MRSVTRSIYIFAAAAVIATILLAGCGGAPNDDRTDTRQIVDGIGRTVTLPSRVEQAVSLAPSVTEMIFAAGAGERLVGVTTYCDFPEKALSIEKVGDTQTPNVEKIIALRPDVVFVSKASQLESFTNTLEQQGATVFVLDPVNLGQVLDYVRILGGIFGTEQAANQAAARLSARIKNLERRQGPLLRVFVQISKEPLFTIGKDSFLSGAIQEAGGLSVTADIPTAYPTLSKETAAALDPDVIILSDSEDNREPNAALKNSKAVTTGRVYRIDPDIISRPGPRLVDAIERIAKYLDQEPKIN